LVNRAIVRAEIVERLGAMLIANATVSGVALILLGSFLLIVAPDLHKGKRLAWRLAFVIGMFLIISGLVGYWWQPVPAVLIFSALGIVLTSPLLLWREHYVAE
jgi:hypothetical protein